MMGEMSDDFKLNDSSKIIILSSADGRLYPAFIRGANLAVDSTTLVQPDVGYKYLETDLPHLSDVQTQKDEENTIKLRLELPPLSILKQATGLNGSVESLETHISVLEPNVPERGSFFVTESPLVDSLPSQKQTCNSVSSFTQPVLFNDIPKSTTYITSGDSESVHSKSASKKLTNLKTTEEGKSHPQILSASQINQLVDGKTSVNNTLEIPQFPLSAGLYLPMDKPELSQVTQTQDDASGLISSQNKAKHDLVEQVLCFKCKLCSYINLDETQVLNHVEEVHAEKEKLENNCVSKQNESTQTENFDGSEELAIDEARYVCNQCQKIFINLKSLYIHYNDKHCLQTEDYIYTQNKTTKDKTVKETDSENNDTLYQEPPPYEEPDPKEQLPPSPKQQPSYEQHHSDNLMKKKRRKLKGSRSLLPGISLEDPFNKLRFNCGVNDCSVSMKVLENVIYHRRCHDDNKFSCPECGKTYPSWKTLSLHLWRTHRVDMELYSCNQCTYKTYNFHNLENVHKRIHSEERPFLCDTCGKGFKTTKQLRNHRVIHSRHKSVKASTPECDSCHRQFSDKRMLRKHKETVHMKMKPFLCNYCGYSASSASTLKMHIRKHTGDKPYTCHLCNYRTADHNSLRRHKMRHSGIKPYKCPHCSYASIQSSTFKVHLNNKHPGQDEGLMFSCHLCSFQTIKKENFISHMSSHAASNNQTKVERNDLVGAVPHEEQVILSALQQVDDQSQCVESMKLPENFICEVMSNSLENQVEEEHQFQYLPTDGGIVQVSTSPSGQQIKSVS